ncbi:alpha-ketoglutarate-dependent dioxygenase AlkB [Algoriphagus sp.]|uniref:alpha-ketoglutarate-dependent dioxygenase AlkB family protein n=1 Tax=Algoriphagus sp. TaxID=1872435 RepID=UPI0025D7912B|nr:alpha-ketoglutarate-dependent dioxygenase AlkB [Algoriphagus sp.]
MQSDLFNDPNKNLLPFDGVTKYYGKFLSKETSDRFFKLLLNEIDWKQEPIKIFGKAVMQPRLTALYGDQGKIYQYSGIQMIPILWTDFLLEIKEKVESLTNSGFTHVLLNQYRDGQDSMGWHRDNEISLGKKPTIASVSFGAVREFQMRLYKEKSNKIKIPLEHGSLLMMGEESQQYWEHQLPKTKKVNSTRINLTFRKIL